MSSFNEMLNGETPLLIDFTATWCGPCKMMSPILEAVKERLGDSTIIIKIDVDQNPALAGKYDIQGVPTLILFQKGKMLWRQSGVVQANQLEKIIREKIGM